MKQCSTCQKFLPLSAFRAIPKYKDGYAYSCVICEREYNKLYRQTHKQQRAKYDAMYKPSYRNKNRQKLQKYHREYGKMRRAKAAMGIQ